MNTLSAIPGNRMKNPAKISAGIMFPFCLSRLRQTATPTTMNSIKNDIIPTVSQFITVGNNSGCIIKKGIIIQPKPTLANIRPIGLGFEPSTLLPKNAIIPNTKKY